MVDIPSETGENFSWRKYFKLNFTGTGPATAIANVVFYFDTPPQLSDPARQHDGVRFYAGATPSYTTPSAADEAGAGGLADVDTVPYDVASPLVVAGGTLLGPSETGTGTQDYVVVQCSLDNTTTPGLKDPRNFYYRYYEYIFLAVNLALLSRFGT